MEGVENVNICLVTIMLRKGNSRDFARSWACSMENKNYCFHRVLHVFGSCKDKIRQQANGMVIYRAVLKCRQPFYNCLVGSVVFNVPSASASFI